nr:redox-sensing transcriptional repressor Rex [uncultured Ruminococcus sp.]
MPKEGVSIQVIRRLPRYYRYLSELDAEGIEKISSTKLASMMNSTASQIRQDLNCFGGFGQQGYGYSVTGLREEIGKILGLDQPRSMILIGAGNLGKAIATHLNFEKLGFKLTAIFEKDEHLIGTTLRDIEIMSDDKIEEYVKENQIDTAVLTMPKEAVEKIIDKLYDCGIRSYWNFSHYDISKKYMDVTVENVHLSDSLMTLSYMMNQES